jgi:hypothetical protein
MRLGHERRRRRPEREFKMGLTRLSIILAAFFSTTLLRHCDALVPSPSVDLALSMPPPPSVSVRIYSQKQNVSKNNLPDFVMSRDDVARLLLDGTNSESRPYMGSSYYTKEAALQDKRLLECIQTTGPDFEQCFFFGATDSMIQTIIMKNGESNEKKVLTTDTEQDRNNSLVDQDLTSGNVDAPGGRRQQLRIPFSATTTSTKSTRIPTW